METMASGRPRGASLPQILGALMVMGSCAMAPRAAPCQDLADQMLPRPRSASLRLGEAVQQLYADDIAFDAVATSLRTLAKEQGNAPEGRAAQYYLGKYYLRKFFIVRARLGKSDKSALEKAKDAYKDYLEGSQTRNGDDRHRARFELAMVYVAYDIDRHAISSSTRRKASERLNALVAGSDDGTLVLFEQITPPQDQSYAVNRPVRAKLLGEAALHLLGEKSTSWQFYSKLASWCRGQPAIRAPAGGK